MKRTHWTVALMTASLMAATLLAAQPASQEAIREGAGIFEAKRCTACHTAGGLGQPDKLSLDKYRLYADPLLFGSVLWNHAAAMREQPPTFRALENLDPWPQLAPGELQKLTAYVHHAAGSYQHQYLVGANPEAGL
jgi:cytochrome c